MKFEKIPDIILSVVVGVFVIILAFAFAYPYPHPDMWHCLSLLKGHVSYETLGLMGHIALGFFAASVYLLLRIIWTIFRASELPEKFFFSQLIPLLGSVLIALLPAFWRAAQHLSPAFLFLLIEVVSCVLWLWSRGCGAYLMYSFAYLGLGAVAAISPLASIFLLLAIVLDAFGRWETQIVPDLDDEDYIRMDGFHESVFSIFAAGVGFIVSMLVFSRYRGLGNSFSWGTMSVLMGWLDGWISSFDWSMTSPLIMSLAFSALSVLVAVCFSRRVELLSESCFTLVVTISGVFAVGIGILAFRATETDTRARLSLIQEHIQDIVRDTQNVRWLFTDGRFDEMLNYELMRTHSSVTLLDMMNPPRASQIQRLKAAAPDFAERTLFAAGGSEVFRAWARERPERLAESAWFMGGGILKLYDKCKQHTAGSVFRLEPKTEDETVAYQKADEKQAAFFKRVNDATGSSTLWHRVFGSGDSSLSAAYDELLWRVCRLGQARAEELSADGNLAEAQKLQDEIVHLNTMNGTLIRQGLALERLLPTAGLVLTSHEALDVSLKRADFALAQRYAQDILNTNPDDPSANFALAMAFMIQKDYFPASQRFERMLKVQPIDPTSLNNLALCYMQLELYDKAENCLKHALELYPNGKEIQENLKKVQEKIHGKQN